VKKDENQKYSGEAKGIYSQAAIAQLQSGEDKTLSPPVVHAAFTVGSPVRNEPDSTRPKWKVILLALNGFILQPTSSALDKLRELFSS
jgi:hypothetical protein